MTGVSYTRERVMENLAASFKPGDNAPYNIAVLHANVGGQTGHADYAPATVDELAAAGFDYWALGHVHTRSVLATEPAMIVYPGNTQGRHAREGGPRGCYQVDVDTHGRAHLEFIETNVVRWAHLNVPITGHSRLSSLVDSMLEQGRSVAAQFAGPTVVRCTISGNGSLHRDLHKQGGYRAGIAGGTTQRRSYRVCSNLHWPRFGPGYARKNRNGRQRFSPAWRKRAADDPVLRQKLMDSLTPLFRRKEIAPPDDTRFREWVERAGSLGIDLLLDS